MKQTIYCLCGIFTISTASATVYDGSYSGTITIINDSIFEKNGIFGEGRVKLGTDVVVNVVQDVSFIGMPIDSSGNVHAYTLNLTGDNVILRDSNFRAITAGLTDYVAFSSEYVGNVNINISGSNIVFDNNSVSGSYPSNRGGAIFIGLPNSVYYNYGTSQQILTITGARTVFSNNHASTGGGAIYNSGAIIDMQQAVNFTRNSACYGGAIYNSFAKVMANLNIGSGSEFIENSATNAGGAIYNDNSYVRIGANTIFRGNKAEKNGGAIYNDGISALLEIDTGTSAVHFETASDSIYNNGGTVNFLGAGTIIAGLTSLTSVRGDGKPIINLGRANAVFDTVTLSDNTTLKTTVWADGRVIKAGNISANTFNIQNNDELKLQIAVENRNILSPDGSIVTILTDRSGNQNIGWDYFGNTEKYPKFVADNNLLYDVEFVSDGVYKIKPKVLEYDPAYDSDIMESVGNAWNMSGFMPGSAAENIANQLYVLLQFSDTLPKYNQVLSDLMPETADVINAIIANNTNSHLRFLSQRMTSGKNGFWANGGYKIIDDGHLYTGHTFDSTFGQDIALLGGALTLGQAFGYSQTSIDNNGRNFDIKNNFELSLYGVFTLPVSSYDLYIGGIIGHGTYKITENKTVLGYNIDSEVDASQTVAQTNIGIKRNLWGIEGGYRYTTIKRGTYTDNIGQHVKGLDVGLSRALARLYIADTDGLFQWGGYIGGELVINSDNAYTNIATAPNGQRYVYTITANTDPMFTFGVNMGLGVTKRISLSVAYDGIFGGNYAEHISKLRFNWAW